MLEKIIGLFKALLEMWSSLSDKKKEEIIGVIVGTFTEIFRQYYKSSKDDLNEEGVAA